MALTLAIVSFSCTGPILGSLLAGSLSVNVGGAWQLTAGMAGFGMALGLPFAVFAMFPNMLKSLPKSGGWLNTTKVILGFLELALAFKFLSNEPRVIIRVSERAHKPIETEITRITSNSGFQGDIQVIGDQLINNGDCAISWDAGSLEKSLEETWSTIDKIIDNVIAERTACNATTGDLSREVN